MGVFFIRSLNGMTSVHFNWHFTFSGNIIRSTVRVNSILGRITQTSYRMIFFFLLNELKRLNSECVCSLDIRIWRGENQKIFERCSSIGGLIDRLIDWLTIRLIDWLDWLIGLNCIEWLIDWLIDWFGRFYDCFGAVGRRRAAFAFHAFYFFWFDVDTAVVDATHHFVR